MAGHPTIQVLLDDGTGTFPHDITSKARLVDGYAIKRGRQNELDSATPGDLRIVLDNNDGRFSPGSTFYGTPSRMRADNRIRVKLTANATTVDRFTGYIQGLPVSWPGGSDQESRVAVSLVDSQGRAERAILRSIVEEQVLAAGPYAYYVCNEPVGASQAGDTSGNQRTPLIPTGTGAAVTFGVTGGPTTDGDLTVVQFAGGKYLAQEPGNGTLGSFTYGCFFETSSTLGTLAALWEFGGDTVTSVIVDAAGKLYLDVGFTVITSASAVNDGAVHHAAVSYDAVAGTFTLYLDGVIVGSATSALAVGIAFRNRLVVGADYESGGEVRLLTGRVGHVFLEDSVLSAATIAAIATAGLTGFNGESGTARISRLAGYVGIPVGTLDASLTNVPATDTTGQSVAAAMRDVGEAELGLVFVNGSGNVTFHNRNRPAAKTAPDITIPAEFLAEDTTVEYDMDGVVNYLAVTARGTGVTQVIRDLASEAAHGRYGESKDYLVATDAEALDRGNWQVGNHAEPAPRIGTAVLDMLSMSAAQQAQVLAIEPNTWIRITGLPSQTPTGTTADLMVQGWSETLNDRVWTLTLNVVARSLFQAWILGDATYGVLGSTTRLYV